MKKAIVLSLLLVIIGWANALSFGQNKVNAVQQDWSQIQTMHFDIYFPKGEDEFGRVVSLMSEDIYYYIKEEFKIPIHSRIPVIFYATKTEFQTTNIIYPLLSEGVGGFTESLRNRVVVPFDGSYAALEELLAHELTHAYINALDSRYVNAFTALRPIAFPFWFSEGLPEYLSIGGEDDYNNMFLMDMVINDRIGKLQETDGYLAYRLGESFLTYIADTWGRSKVPEYFFALRNMSNVDEATKKVFGMDFKDLESRWNYQLKRDYFPRINSHNIPMESMDQRTFHAKDGSYFNFAPRFSPDGSRYVYYSNAGARYSIWMAGTQGLADNKMILRGESTGKLEEFYYFRSTLSWFPDNRRIAFAAKTSDGDRIHIYDVDNTRIESTISIPSLSAIYEVDVSPDGKHLVMAAQSGMQADLYLYDLESKQLTQLTNDDYNDANPRFSPDGSRIAFSSERRYTPGKPRYGLFTDLVRDVFYIELASKGTIQVTRDDYDCYAPVWADEGNKLVFISNRNRISNLEVIDLQTNSRGELAKTMAGIFAADIGIKDGNMLVANYFDGAWDIYYDDNPFSNITYEDYKVPENFKRTTQLMDSIDLDRLNIFNKRTKAEIKRSNPARKPDPRRPIFKEHEYTFEDSLYLFPDFSWDDKPDSTRGSIEIKPYKSKFALDYLWGGMAYSSSMGAFGNVELGFSDLMGNHGIGISLGISSSLEQTNMLLSYIYLKKRADYGFGLYNFYDEYLYRRVLPGQDEYMRLRSRETGVNLVFRYPFSRFSRLELDNRFYQVEQSWDWLPPANVADENWIEDVEINKDTVFAPGLSLVFDNSLSGSTGPLVGLRALYHIRKSFAIDNLEYLTNYIDVRSYNLFSKRYSLAMRLNAGVSTGKNPDRFSLDGYYGVRALDTSLSGHKKALTSLELRFPFLDYFAIAFPIPLVLGNIRGSIFADVGSVWDDTDKFRGMNNDKLQDIKLGYGVGPRLSLGYFVLKFDVTWLTDLSEIGKPTYYLSLTEDF